MAFDVAAHAYDRFMGGWSRLLSGPMADLAGVAVGQRVLDVGCGPGALTSELVARLGAAGVAAVDPSESFVAAARARNPDVDVRVATAEALPHPDDAFDATLAQLVVHFMSDPVAGLREMARVTRPGGVVAACVWDYGGGRHPLWPFWEAVAELDPNAPNESGLAGARQRHLVELFESAGLGQIREVELPARRAFGGFDEWWEPFLMGVGPAGKYAARLDEGALARLRDRCRVMLPAGSFELTAVAWAASGLA
jgi:SAM-dependent methyltransferase